MDTKQSISITAQVHGFEEAKELLVELEALSKKYNINCQLYLSCLEDFEELYKPIESHS